MPADASPSILDRRWNAPKCQAGQGLRVQENAALSAAELLELNQQLLECIARADWETYASLVDESITCFEPEARGHLVKGLDFHKFYFDLGAAQGARNTTMAAPKVRVMGDAAVVAYVRIVQYLDEHSTPATSHYEETRVWHREDGRWRHVHFHRSPCG